MLNKLVRSGLVECVVRLLYLLQMLRRNGRAAKIGPMHKAKSSIQKPRRLLTVWKLKRDHETVPVVADGDEVPTYMFESLLRKSIVIRHGRVLTQYLVRWPGSGDLNQ